MSVTRWEHLAHTSPVLRLGSWLIASFGSVNCPGLCRHSLAFEFEILETTRSSR